MTKLIVIEGVDGAGKSTIIKRLRDEFKEDVAVEFVTQPGTTPMGNQIRRVLKEAFADPPFEVERMLFGAAHADLMHFIEENLMDCKYIISDRSSFVSDWVYTEAQYPQAEDPRPIEVLEKIASMIPVPKYLESHLIILAMTEEEIRKRKGDLPEDRFNNRPIEWFLKVNDLYCHPGPYEKHFVSTTRIPAVWPVDMLVSNVKELILKLG